jgi:hypothetical protein
VIYLNKAETQACVLPYTNQCHIKDTTRMLFYTAIHICMTFFSITYSHLTAPISNKLHNDKTDIVKNISLLKET